MSTERTTTVVTAPTYISVGAAARELSVSEQTIRRYLKEGIIEGRRFGRTIRIPRAAVYEYKQGVER